MLRHQRPLPRNYGNWVETQGEGCIREERHVEMTMRK